MTQMIQIDDNTWINEDHIVKARMHLEDHPNRPDRMLEIFWSAGGNMYATQVKGLWIGSVMAALGLSNYLREIEQSVQS